MITNLLKFHGIGLKDLNLPIFRLRTKALRLHTRQACNFDMILIMFFFSSETSLYYS